MLTIHNKDKNFTLQEFYRKISSDELSNCKNNFTKKLDKYDNTIFHYVMWYGNYKYANRLIEKDADINIENKYDATELLVGAQNGNFDSVKFLIDNDADIN